MDPIIKVKNVTKIYKVGNEKIMALNNVNLTINKGEFCCLLGTSGSGKSTLLNIMAGIEKVSKGQVYIRDKDICKFNEEQLAIFRQKYLGFVFQAYNLISSLTALENVTLPLIFKEVPNKLRLKQAKQMLIEVGLKDRLNHKPSQMSGGQQQRVGIARAFVSRPQIIFADEPTGNLDTKTTIEIIELIKKMAKESEQTIVIVTHDQRIAEYADKVIHIHDGVIQKVEEKLNKNNVLAEDGGNVR